MTILDSELALGDFIEVAELLIENGAEVNVQGNWTERWGARTPLIWAAAKDAYRVAKLLISHNANKFTAKNDGTQAIHQAANDNSAKVLKLLIQSGVTIDEPNPFGSTPLSYASQHDTSHNMVKYLVEHGAFINSKGEGSKTPLMWASKNNAIQNVKYLIKNCADTNLTNDKDETALAIARRHFLNDTNFSELVDVLSNKTFIDSVQINCTRYYNNTKVSQPASRLHFDHTLIELS